MNREKRSSKHGTRRGLADELVEDWQVMECLPTFKEARDLEWIRVEGKFNMITQFHDVQTRLFDAGAYAGVNWLERCRNNNVVPMVAWEHWHDHMVEEYGEINTWVQPKLRHQYECEALRSAQRRLNEQAEELELQRQELEAAGPVSPTRATFTDLPMVE